MQSTPESRGNLGAEAAETDSAQSMSSPGQGTTDTVPALSAEEELIWRSWLAGTHRLASYLDEQLRLDGLDFTQYEILANLSTAPEGRLSMTTLADLVRQDRSCLVQAISRMEVDGLVSRTADPHDRRGVAASITERGQAVVEQATPHHIRAMRRILIDIVDLEDLNAVGRVMQAILTAEI